MNKSIGIITATHNRPQVLRLFCASIQRIRHELDMYFPCFVVVSNQTDADICMNYSINHVIQDNFPVSERFNTGMGLSKKMGWDYTLITGDDDIISTDTFKRIYDTAQSPNDYDLIGIDSIYFFGTVGEHKGKLVKLNHGKLLGVGKTISSRVLKEVDYRPWNISKNYGLDAMATQRIAPYVKTWKVLQDTFVCDIKSTQNINKMSVFAKRYAEEDVNLLMSILGEEEKQILKSIML